MFQMQSHDQNLGKLSFAATGNNKELEITFDADIKLPLTLPNDKSPGVINLDPPIHSSSVKIEIKSVYTSGENGFAAIRLWASRKLGHLISSLRKLSY